MDEHLIEVLKKFAAKAATAVQAMRALTEHNEWYLPAEKRSALPLEVAALVNQSPMTSH